MKISALLSVVLGALVLAAAPASARADQQVASAGSVTATLSFEHPSHDRWTGYSLAVSRAGTSAFSGAVHIPGCGSSCSPVGDTAVQLRDLDGDGEPEVLVDLYTGGAHCCEATWIARWTGTTYSSTTRNWGDPGYRLENLDGDGRLEIVTGDDRFAYAFAAYASSAFPLRIYSYSRGTLSDVTRTHAAQLRSDATKLQRQYEKVRSGRFSLGLLAAWTADEYLLGRRTQADAFLRAERRAGRLRSVKGWKQGAAFVAQLQRRLRAWGY